MRALPVLLTAISAAGAAQAQQRPMAAEIHCEWDGGKSGQSVVDAELPCLERLNGLAFRDGDVLRLALEDGKSQTFTDQSQACNEGQVDKCLTYRLSAFYPVQNLFVVQRFAYESWDFLLVSRRTGAITKIDDHPHLSPSGQRLVVAAAIEAWRVEREIAVYCLQDGLPKLEWDYKAKVYEMWEFAAWDGDERIQLRVTLHKSDGPELTTQSAELRQAFVGWRRAFLGWRLNKNVGP